MTLVSVAMGESFFAPRFFAVKEMWNKAQYNKVMRFFALLRMTITIGLPRPRFTRLRNDVFLFDLRETNNKCYAKQQQK